MKDNRFRPRLPNTKEWKDLIQHLNGCDPTQIKSMLVGESVHHHEVEKDETAEKTQIKTTSTRVKTYEQLLIEAEIEYEIGEDKKPILKHWICKQMTSNFWEVGAKNPTGVILPETLYQIKCVFVPKVAESESIERIREGILLAISGKSISVQIAPKKADASTLMIEPMITDHHIGKIAYYDAIEPSWNVKKAVEVYKESTNYTLKNTDSKRVNHWLLPIGNDLLNIDNTINTTTAGTPQQTAVFWEHLFTHTVECVKAQIDMLVKTAPVKIIMVSGNHDYQSVFSLGSVLAAMYANNKAVTVDNTAITRKYHSYGLNLAGFTHGNNIKAQNLHSIMSNDEPELFGKSKFRAFHVGHLHKNAKYIGLMTSNKDGNNRCEKDEYGGVIVEICPSLCPTDRWHYSKGYTGNVRRSKTFVWEKTSGIIQELYFNL